ncbi:thioredoxin-related transmembrane protein 2 homolog [Contarinia nasturtii]|uniref:thioredoxin-related transmembrane protein 2 homolog n=1 Tax=Contarinia nasturtii TaxID=265458 RepID=UPI0012D3AF04|nr:thioredoxin-related transmembrane protein 2 homolog [Contarinia nasturtii]
MGFKKDFILLTKPYYCVNILLSLSYLLAKKAPGICVYLFTPKESECELDGRETEILFFLAIVVMIRTRKTGSVTMINYLTSSFIYTKIANLILWAYADYLYGVIFGVVFIITALVIPEPTYSGPEHVTYFRTEHALDDELESDKRIVWIIAFYTVWNPACVNFAPIFSELSAEYNLKNFRFGKVDVGRFPATGKKYHVSDSSLSRQLPTIILFKNGKEFLRRPCVDVKGKLQTFFFSKDNIKAAFILNTLYKESKENGITTDEKKQK